MMQVIQTIAGVRREHGGPSRSVPALCDALAQCEIDVHLVVGVSSNTSVENNFPTGATNIHAIVESPVWGRAALGGAFRATIRSITCRGRSKYIIHDHGVWLGTNHAIAVAASRLRLVRIVSPRGMLSQWSLQRRKWLKKIMWHLYQKRDLEKVDGFHATSESEARDIRRLGFTQPIAMLPNGLDTPQSLPVRRRTDRRTILFMSRIHPVKGILELLRAFKSSQVGPEWHLLILGPDEGGYKKVVESLITELELSKSVTLAGPVGDCEKWQNLVDADLFVLPSFTENYGIVVAEALSAGLPVITTTGTPWKVIADKEIGWWVEPTVSALEMALRSACSISRQELDKKGLAAQVFASQQYSWLDVAVKLKQFYNELSYLK